jgi:hypothetical protein
MAAKRPHMQYDGSQIAGGGTPASVLLAQRERHTSRPWHQNDNVFMEKQWVGLDLALPFRRRYISPPVRLRVWDPW